VIYLSPELKKKKVKNLPKKEATKSERILLNPEEWKDPAGLTVIGEYHKEGLPGTKAGDESDLDAFEKQWHNKGGSQTASEYHKQDAPYMETQSEQDGHQPRMRETSTKTVGEESHPAKKLPQNTDFKGGKKKAFFDNLLEKVTRKDNGKDNHQLHNTAKATDSPTNQPITKQTFSQRVLDISSIEVLAYTVFRAMFGKGIRVPLKREGSMDMDIAVKDTDIIINTNDVSFEPPKLQIWHIIFAYKGKPVLEYGRGVKRIKVHYYRAFVMLIAMWWGGRKKRKAKEKADKAADIELAGYAAGNEKSNEKKGTGGDQ